MSSPQVLLDVIGMVAQQTEYIHCTDYDDPGSTEIQTGYDDESPNQLSFGSLAEAEEDARYRAEHEFDGASHRPDEVLEER